jgi:ATP-binding cassette subfamily B protein/subfamily B ATP-binding cassette protein MsbA
MPPTGAERGASATVGGETASRAERNSDSIFVEGAVESAAGKVKPRYIRQYVAWMWPYRYGVIALFAVSLVITGLDLVWPLCFRQIVHVVSPGYPGEFSSKIRNLNLIAVAVLLVLLTKQGLVILRQWFLEVINAKFVLRLRMALFQHLMRLPLSDLSRMKTGSLVSRLCNDVDHAGHLMQNALLLPAVSAVRVGMSIGMLFWLNWRLALVSMLATAPLSGLTWARVKRVRPLYRRMHEIFNDAAGIAQESIAGIRVVRAFRREPGEARRFAIVNHAVVRKLLAALRIGILLDSGWGLALPGVSLLLVWYGGNLVLRGKMTLADIFAFQIYGAMLLAPLQQLMGYMSTTQKELAAAENVFEVLQMPLEDPDPPDAADAPDDIREIQFDKVSFEYNRGRPVLRDLNLIVPTGKTVALVGPSGAGKTTITDLLARFHAPTTGSIRINGSDVRHFKLQCYRRLLAIVQQETFLFDGTVRENIAYGRRGATPDQVLQAAIRANAHEFILQMPQGYETIIGERGVRLSGGQKQRLAIARALLADPKILILDEATSHLDAQSEHLIQLSLFELLKNRTTFIIAHRLSTIQHAHIIVVLEKGEIKEIGGHDDLMRRGGLYCEMVRRQQASRLDEIAETERGH